MTNQPNQPTPEVISGTEDPLSTRTGDPGIAELHSASTASAALAPSATRRSQGDEVSPQSPEQSRIKPPGKEVASECPHHQTS